MLPGEEQHRMKNRSGAGRRRGRRGRRAGRRAAACALDARCAAGGRAGGIRAAGRGYVAGAAAPAPPARDGCTFHEAPAIRNHHTTRQPRRQPAVTRSRRPERVAARRRRQTRGRRTALDHRQHTTRRVSDRPVDALKTTARLRVLDPAGDQIRIHGGLGTVMGRHVVPLAALLVQPQPPPSPLQEIVLTPCLGQEPRW